MENGMQLTGEVRVVVLHVAAAGLVQDLELGLVGLGDVTEVLLVGAVHVLGVGLALNVAQVVPVRSGQSDLQVLDLVSGDLAGKVLELVDIGAADVLDLACADDGLTRLVASLEEGSNVGSVRAEDVGLELGDLLESVQTGEESTPEHWIMLILRRCLALRVGILL